MQELLGIHISAYVGGRMHTVTGKISGTDNQLVKKGDLWQLRRLTDERQRRTTEARCFPSHGHPWCDFFGFSAQNSLWT
jgi:hypothetical protein